MAKLWTQSIHSKCLRFTQRPALDPSLGRKIARRLTGGLGVWKTAAPDTRAPLPLRGTSTAKKREEKQRQGPEGLQYGVPPFRGRKWSPPQMSAQAPLCCGVFREGKTVLYGGLVTLGMRRHWRCDSRIQECQLSQTLGF